MQRSKFPYTAQSSAKVIRHAVSIDERRAKFRSDLITNTNKKAISDENSTYRTERNGNKKNAVNGTFDASNATPDRFRRRSHVNLKSRSLSAQVGMEEKDNTDPSGRLMARSRSASRDVSVRRRDGGSIHSCASSYLPAQIPTEEDDAEDESTPQDVEELWFPGGHGDLGGGWVLDKDDIPLSLVPLVWMAREAQRAGLEFDSEQMLKLKCCDDNLTMDDDSQLDDSNNKIVRPSMPDIQITGASTGDIFNSPRRAEEVPGWAPGFAPPDTPKSAFQQDLECAMRKSILHDVLLFGNGLNRSQVMAWKCMEYLPFRRMDLRPDGTWKAISLPLPMGEVRDIPEDAHIHHSAILRMKADERYRPGNLIVGGGGRGVRKAPKELGIGNWEILKGGDDQIGCIYVRKGESTDKKINKGEDQQMEAVIEKQAQEEKRQGGFLTTEGPMIVRHKSPCYAIRYR